MKSVLVTVLLSLAVPIFACETFTGEYYCPAFGRFTITVKPDAKGVMHFTAAKNGRYALAQDYDLNGVPHPDKIWACIYGGKNGECTDKVMNTGVCENGVIKLKQNSKSDRVIGMTSQGKPVMEDVLITDTQEFTLTTDGRLFQTSNKKVFYGGSSTPEKDQDGGYRCINADNI